MKKYLYSIVLATLILMSTTVVNAANEVYYKNRKNIEMTETEYNNLLALGFTERHIEGMNEEEFLANKDLDATLLSSSKKYIKTTTAMRNGIKVTTYREITEEEAMEEKKLQSQNVPNRGPAGNYYDGVYSNSVFAMTVNISSVGSTYMRFMNNAEWIVMPSDRYNDVIGIGIESDKVQMSTGVIFEENWLTTGGSPGEDETCTPKETSTGGLAIFELPDVSIQTLYMTIYFNVMKKANVGTITSLYATGDYAHAISSVPASNLLSHISINYSAGLMIDGTYGGSFLSNPSVAASFQGTW